MDDGQREIWNEMQADAAPSIQECIEEIIEIASEESPLYEALDYLRKKDLLHDFYIYLCDKYGKLNSGP